MPTLNPDKCYTQQPQRLPVTVPADLPENWQTEFYELLSTHLGLNDIEKTLKAYDHQTDTQTPLTEKEMFFKQLNRHAGAQSAFSLKPQLLESLKTLYVIFTHPDTTDEQRRLIASRIKEDVSQCSPGFTNRVNFTITLFNMPQNIDELVALARFKLVDRIASIIAAQNPQGVHVHNRVIKIANAAGFGVWSINTGDVHSQVGSSNLSDEDIVKQLQTGFGNHFQLFALVNALRDELEALIAVHEYQGKRDLANSYTEDEYVKFYECINVFMRTPIPMGELLETDEEPSLVTDINWRFIKHQLLQQLREENYVTLSDNEVVLLETLLKGDISGLDSEILNTLTPHGYELVQCLEFFSLWSMAQKTTLVSAYLNNKSSEEKKEVLAILYNEAPQLTAELKKEPNLQGIYFAIAITEKDATSVRDYIEMGADINKALLLLFSQEHKRDTLFWLHDNPFLLEKLTVVGMNTIMPEGKYQGKTIAETLVSTKKGRQLLSENASLQSLLAQTIISDRLEDILKQAETESINMSTPLGFFKKPNAKAVELVQWIVYGDLTKAEALLKANPLLVETLLSEKVTVTDYSRRKIKNKTAFQAALCAMDNELCEMLAQYMSKEEITSQYQEIFPQGHEAYYQAQTPFDFSEIIAAISQSSEADVKKALSLDLPNETALWAALEKFRSAFTKHSSFDAVFNPQHLLRAFALYDNQFDNWNWNQRDLFWRQVVGFTQRFLPANIAMDFAQGLYNRVENQDAAARSFKFKWDGGSIFPPAFESFSGLGFEYAAWVGGRGWARVWRARVGLAAFKTYVEQKKQSWANYAARADLQL